MFVFVGVNREAYAWSSAGADRSGTFSGAFHRLSESYAIHANIVMATVEMCRLR